MREIVPTTRFKKDARRMRRRGMDLSELRSITRDIAEGKQLEPRHRDHKLTGSFRDHRECHVRPDWLLIYQLTKNELVLIRTGSHSELFGR